MYPAVHALLTGLPFCTGRARRQADLRRVQDDRAARRARAIRLGWNDAASGAPRHQVDPGSAEWYEQGYRGGMIYRQAARPPASQPR